MLTFAEQIYDILVGEIERGRWQVNDRLPGVIALSRKLGFGTKTIQTAYDRLKEDGYVRMLGYRGTYLKCQHPLSSSPEGMLGILISEKQAGDPLVLWYEHVILQQARRKNLVIDLRVLPATLAAHRVREPGALFNQNVQGIISLLPFRSVMRSGNSPGLLPLVFLCPPYETCSPKVCADVREAYFDLTARAIRYGHQRVVFSEDSVEPDPRQTELHREGYLEAMAAHDLPVDYAWIEASRKVRNADLSTVNEYVQSLLRTPQNRRPTAIIAGSLGRNTVLNRMAPSYRLNIPSDLSVVSIGSAYLDGRKGLQVTGMLPDFDRMVEQCLALLHEQRTSDRCEFTSLFMRMHFVEGVTLAPRPGFQAAAHQNQTVFDPPHDLAALSQTVQV